MRFPDILVVGVKKCGTGAIIEQLGIHPQISSPYYTIQVEGERRVRDTRIVFLKENQYYSRDWIYNKGLEHYIVI